MPVPIIRKTIWALAAAIMAVVLILALLPFIASAQIVRTRIAEELSDWSGYRVSLGAAPEIDVWPSFRTVLKDVSFWGPVAGQPAVLLAERIEADLSAVSAIAGNIAFSSIRIVRPVLHVARRGDLLYLPDSPGGGRVHQAISDMKAGRTPPEQSLRSIGFIEGRIVRIDGTASREVVSGIAGAIEWPGASRPASLNATAMWRGEQVGVAVFVKSPAAFLSGAPSTFNASLQAAPLAASFNGSAQFIGDIRLDGALESRSPSLRRAIEWSQAGITPGEAIGAVSVKGHVVGNLQRLRIADAVISLAGNPGVGALELSLGGQVPTVAGTLAFDTLDIGSFLAAFDAPAVPGNTEPRMFDLSFSDKINLDLRLSAANATGGPAVLTDVAATAQVRSGLAAFDVSDATAFGGTLQAGFRVDRKPEGDVGEMRVSASDVDWGAVAAAIGWRKNPPKARGSLSAVLRSPVDAWSALPRTMSGTVSGKLGRGTIAGIDLKALLAHAPGQDFFPLSDAAEGSVAIEDAEFKATLLGGAARIDTAVARTARETITLGGIVSYVGKSLAMSASVGPRDMTATGAADDMRHFFVGGSWNAPFLTPSLPVWSAE
ncbi:MAG: AsmA-like C-terminal region-containing protein [Mesorhizobium sp.]|nr:AsmA-like C-terminal region-containing protein [Mesorhizobium sp.]